MVTFNEAFASDSRTIAIDCDDVLCQTNETVAESEFPLHLLAVACLMKQSFLR
jgi:hypothetical protein